MNRLKSILLASAMGIAIAGGAAAEEVVLKAVTGVPAPSPVAQSFFQYMERVNERGKGIVRIDYLGGPEATPPSRQAAALTRGIIDVLHAPSSFYAGSVKEVDVLLGVNKPITELRTNGAFDLLNERWGEQINAHIVSWYDTSVGFNIYTTKEPKVDGDKVSLDGMKLFTTPTYRDFQTELGATPVAIDIAEIMTALERGVIDGFGWPNYGLVALGFGREAKYRIDPQFYSGNTPLLVNKDKWESLPEEAKKVLNDVAIEWEAEAPAYLKAFKEQEEAEMKAAGMQIYQLPPEAAASYRALAYKVLQDRLEKAGGETGKKLWDLVHTPE